MHETAGTTPNPKSNMNLMRLPKIEGLDRPIFCEAPHFYPPRPATRMAWRNGNDNRPSRYIGLCEQHARREPCAACGNAGELKDDLGYCLIAVHAEGGCAPSAR